MPKEVTVHLISGASHIKWQFPLAFLVLKIVRHSSQFCVNCVFYTPPYGEG